MKITLDISVLTTGAIIAQGVFSSVILLFQRNNTQANRFLSLLMLLFSLWLCDSFFRKSGIYTQNPNFYFLPIYYSFAFGPLVYFYTRSLTEQNFVLKPFHAFHFVPAFIQGCFYLFVRSQDYSFRRDFWFDIHRPYTYDFEFNLTLLSLLIYLVLSVKSVLTYQKWISNRFSQLAKINLNWLRITLALLFVLSAGWLIEALLREIFYYYPDQTISSLLMGLCVLILAGGGLLQAHVSESKIVPAEIHQEVKLIQSEEIDQQLLNRISQHMQAGQYFLDPQLTLKDFAHKLNTPPRLISLHINKGMGVSFIDFVNQYRVELVKEKIEQGEAANLSLLGIALESGFSSKSTFNRVFKKITGQSPSDYQKEMQNKN